MKIYKIANIIDNTAFDFDVQDEMEKEKFDNLRKFEELEGLNGNLVEEPTYMSKFRVLEKTYNRISDTLKYKFAPELSDKFEELKTYISKIKVEIHSETSQPSYILNMIASAQDLAYRIEKQLVRR